MFGRCFTLSLWAVASVLLAGTQPAWASAVTLNIRVNASANDATQDSGGGMKLTDSEMKFEQSTWMGLRFTNVTIPRGAYITAAHITFRASASTTPTTTPTIYGQDVSSAAAFTTSSNNISSRTRTTATVSWSIPSWTSGQNYNTPSIKGIVQEIVNRSDWSSGNHLAVLINTLNSGADRLTRSYNSSSSLAPLLYVEYVVVAPPVATRLLFVVGNSGSLTAQETARRTMFQAFGYTVTNISASASQATFDTNAAANDVAYISEEINSGDLNTKLKGKALGIVNEEPALADDFSVAANYSNPTSNAITVALNTHFITSPFSLGSLTITSSSQSLNAYSGNMASELSTLGTVSSVAALCAVEMNGKLNDGTRAAGRRVQMPWGGNNFDFNTLAPDGINLLSRALAWAGGVVAYWKLDETTGTSAMDASVNLKHGTLSNFSFATSAATNARLNGGLTFDGANDYVSATNGTMFQMNRALSISAWIKGDAWSSGDDVDVILRKGEGNPNNYQLAVENGYAALGLDGNDGSNVRGNTPLQTGQWYHVVGTWDGSTIRIYVNGVLDMTPTARAAPILIDTRPVYLGGRSGTDLFDGTLDDVRLFNHALALDEVAALKSQGQKKGVRIIKWVEIR